MGSSVISLLLGLILHSVVTAQNANIAGQGRAAQSSNYTPASEASKAIDGNADSNYYHLSCTHTNMDDPAWWGLTFPTSYYIQSVAITNRGDCCGERLNGAELLVGDSPENNGNNNPRCAQITSIPNGATVTFQCNGMKGRYINIVIRGKAYITLCEVQVYGRPAEDDVPVCSNVALRGQATQSSIYGDKTSGPLAQAGNAIDGNKDSAYLHGSCCHTNNDNPSWWSVDLKESHKVQFITITNRGSSGKRLDAVEILVGNLFTNNGNDNPRCAIITSIPDGGIQTFQCNNMIGRYVNLINRGKREYLHVCEVEVYGVPSG